jgi:hypothetical protein
MRLQIPTGLFAGDTFIVTPDNGRVFTVIVPENAIPGIIHIYRLGYGQMCLHLCIYMYVNAYIYICIYI